MTQVNTIATPKFNLSALMHAAWTLIKAGKAASLSAALKAAWKAAKLKAALRTSVVTFQFRKADGSIRKAVGTLLKSAISYVPKGTGRKPNYSTVAYRDVEKNGYRSFSIASLL